MSDDAVIICESCGGYGVTMSWVCSEWVKDECVRCHGNGWRVATLFSAFVPFPATLEFIAKARKRGGD